MNALDVAILGIMGVSLFYSTWKGFARDVFSLVGLVGGFVVAARLYPVIAAWIHPWIASPTMASLVGWILIFLITLVAISALGRMVRASLRLLQLGWLDRLAGSIFGLLKGVLICAGLVVVLVAFLPSQTPLLTRSRLAPRVMAITRELGRWLPGEMGERLRNEPAIEEGRQERLDSKQIDGNRSTPSSPARR